MIALLRRLHRRKVSSRQAGFALVITTLAVAILGAIVGEFGYNARVELESAQNARDELRAEYLARSGINLSRLLIKVQQKVIDPNRAQPFVGDLQLADFASYLAGAFGGSKEEQQGLGDLIGLGTGDIKGIGLGRDATFDVDIKSEDGKINVNCGGGLNPLGNGQLPGAGGQNTQRHTSSPGGGAVGGAPIPIANAAQALYVELTALFFPPRYNRLFDNPDAQGQYTTRDELARGIIDWTDIDEQRFDPAGPSSAAEDYRYDALADPYRAHNNFMDTVDELQLVKGVGDDFWGAFGEMVTVYGRCQVNLAAVKPNNWPISAAIIRAAAKNPQDPALLDDVNVAALAQQISTLTQLLGGLHDTSQFAQLAGNGAQPPQLPGAPGGAPPANGAAGATALLGGAGPQGLAGMPTLAPVQLDVNRLNQLATVGARQIYRLDSTGTIQRPGTKKIQVHIRAIWDTQHFNQNTTSGDINDRQGTWVYWRME